MDSAQVWFCRDLWVDAAKNGGGNKPGGGRGHRRGTHKRALDSVRENLGPLFKRDAEPAPKADEKRDAAPEPVPEPAPEAAEEKKINKPAKGGDKAKEEKKDEDPAERKDRREDGSDKTAGDNVGSNLDAMEEDASNPAPEALKNDEHTYLFPNSAYEAARILVNPRCLTTYGGVSHTKLALDLFGGRHGHSHTAKQNLVIDEWQGAPDSFVCQEMRTTGGRTAQKSQRRVSFLLQYEVSNET
jgi:pyruvate/2-oxoglutarate dehydrogenase complex dihydrolipoamide acyltransferase (E2) component